MNALSLCSSCHREVPASSRFCPTCGWDLRDSRSRLRTGLLPSSQLLHTRYRVIRKLAQGGQSAVYAVIDTFSGNKQCAVKEMSEANLGPTEREKAVNDFLREADMLRTLDHPALAKVFDRFVDNHKHYLVMEYVLGHNLEDELIGAGHPLEWKRVLAWGVALCDVLAYLHSRTPPIIYRDLKPANVMLQPDGNIKLIDFGIARWLHPMRTHDTSKLGTDGYAPLEQYNARSEPRSDLYALGASLYHLLTGRVPEASPLRTAGRALTPVRSVNPQVPEPLERVILCSLNLQAEDRFTDARQMRAALEWAALPESQRHDNVSADHMPGIPAPAPWATGHPSSAGNGGAVLSGVNTLGRTGAVAASPKLQVRPLRLDAGYLEADDVAVLLLEVTNQGGSSLRGRTETNLACLSVEPEILDTKTATLQVRIDTTNLMPGPYTCHLAIRTNGGDQIIPVRFVVRPPIGAATHQIH
ncbi:MAG: serine/threonine-protein kinase [Ktedonobacterales bacterium]